MVRRSQVSDWLDRCQALAGTPEKLRELAATVRDENSRKLLLKRATEWGSRIMIDSAKHWSSYKA